MFDEFDLLLRLGAERSSVRENRGTSLDLTIQAANERAARNRRDALADQRNLRLLRLLNEGAPLPIETRDRVWQAN